MSNYWLPGTVLSTIHAFSHWIFMAVLWDVLKKKKKKSLPTVTKSKAHFRVYDLNYYNYPCSLNILSPFLISRERNCLSYLQIRNCLKKCILQAILFHQLKNVFNWFIFYIVLRLPWENYGLWNQTDLDLNPSSANYYLHELK